MHERNSSNRSGSSNSMPLKRYDRNSNDVNKRIYVVKCNDEILGLYSTREKAEDSVEVYLEKNYDNRNERVEILDMIIDYVDEDMILDNTIEENNDIVRDNSNFKETISYRKIKL